jgi:cobalamin biosynthesis protein CobD/CbiB
MLSLIALAVGFILDLIIGDPSGWPHLILGYGKLIPFFERVLRRVFSKTQRGELVAGVFLVVIMRIISLGAGIGILILCQLIHPYLRVAVESLMVWQCLSLRSLQVASLTVYKPLMENDLPAARLAVKEIVGRDTANLDEQGVTRAAVETVAENTSDGIIAPLLLWPSAAARWACGIKPSTRWTAWSDIKMINICSLAGRRQNSTTPSTSSPPAWPASSCRLPHSLSGSTGKTPGASSNATA